MLKQRIITALFLLPAVIASILLLPVDLFSIVWAAILSVAAYEWLKLSGLKNKLLLLLGVVALNVAFALIWFYPLSNIPMEGLFVISWVLGSCWVLLPALHLARCWHW